MSYIDHEDVRESLYAVVDLFTHSSGQTVCALLNDLFVGLASSEASAVLPEVELAKLALLTSKDEEEAHPERAAAATSTGSADTDSTLVESQMGLQTERDQSSPPPLLPPSPPPQSSSMDASPSSPRVSVLGKRTSEELEHERNERRSPMEVDGAPPPSMTLPPTAVELPPSTQPREDVEMQEASSSVALRPVGPPPLPPRRKTEPVGEMMFGSFSLGFLRFGSTCLIFLMMTRQTERRLGMHGQLYLPDRMRAAV